MGVYPLGSRRWPAKTFSPASDAPLREPLATEEVGTDGTKATPLLPPAPQLAAHHAMNGGWAGPVEMRRRRCWSCMLYVIAVRKRFTARWQAGNDKRPTLKGSQPSLHWLAGPVPGL